VPGVTLLSLTILVVWRTGPGPVPNVAGFEGIARAWPLFPVPKDQAYVLREALGQALYHASGWSGAGHFIAFHAIALAVSGVVLALWMAHRLGAQRGTISTCLLLLSPLTAVLLEWIGMYDAFSVLVWVLLVISLRFHPVAQAAVAVLGGLQNFEQFFVSVLLLALLPEVGRTLGLRARPVPLILGALAGKAALELYLRHVGAAAGTRASFLAEDSMRDLVVSSFAALAPVIVFSALGGLWVPAIRMCAAGWPRASRALRWRGAAAAAVVLGVGAATADHTRVMALVSFPLLTLFCMQVARHEETVLGWLQHPDTWLLVLIPPTVVGSTTLLAPGLDLSIWNM
jgi:hypothetical protein